MRCQTCGKKIHLQMKECPNCGAMIPLPEKPAPAAGANSAGKPNAQPFDWKSVLTPREAPPPPFGSPAAPKPQQRPAENEWEKEWEEEEQAESTTPAAPPAPVAPAWGQYIFPVILMLWVAFRFFGPDIKRYLNERFAADRNAPAESAAPAPELRRLVLCERVEAGQPVGARSKFSRTKDKVATALAVWQGEASGQGIQLNWISPRGKPLAASQKLVRLPAAPATFLVVGELPIGEFSEVGNWRIEVVLDGKAIASYNFTIEP